MKLFECQVRSIVKEVFRKRVYQVRLSTVSEGEICIRERHEDMEQFLGVGKLIISLDEKLTNSVTFFVGHGLLEVRQNILRVIACPIVENLDDADPKLSDSYGNQYIQIWKKLG